MSKRWWRPARLVFLTVHEDADFARAALDAGGLGYVVKARLASDLLPARSVSPSPTVPTMQHSPASAWAVSASIAG